MERRKCFVKLCENKNVRVHEKLSYHGLPTKNLKLQRQWLEWLAKQNDCDVQSISKTNTFVCSEHFGQDDVVRKRLKAGAVPSVVRVVLKDNEENNDPSVDDRYREFSSVVEIDMNCAPSVSEDCTHGVSELVSSELSVPTDIVNAVAVPLTVYDNTCNTVHVELHQENSIFLHGNIVAMEEFFGDRSYSEFELNEQAYEECDMITTSTEDTVIFQESKLSDMSANITVTSKLPCESLSNMNKKTTKSGRKCSAEGCATSQGSFFTFPTLIRNNQRDIEGLNRCRQWIKNSGNLKLLDNILPISEEKMSVYPVCGTRDVEIAITEEVDLGRGYHVDDLSDGPDGPDILDAYQKNFHKELFSLEWRTCDNCKAKFFCKKDFKQKCVYSKVICQKFKNLELDDIPEELKDLTYIEEQLIAKIHPVVSVIKLKGHQLGYKGHVINFPQDVTGFAKTLPHKVNDLSCVLTIRASSNLKPIDFQVRADRVKKALIWLKNNNRYYFDIEISQDNLDLLPEDGNVFDLVQGFNVDEDNNTEKSPLEMIYATSPSKSMQNEDRTSHSIG